MNKNSIYCPVEPIQFAIYTIRYCAKGVVKVDKHKISIIGVPLDHGQSRRGVDMGPSAIRYAGVIERLEAIGHEVIDEGNIQIEVAKNAETQNSKLKNLNEVIKANKNLAEKVEIIWKVEGSRLFSGETIALRLGRLRVL